jgi:hypothetical protein
LNPATQFRTPDLRGAFQRGAGGGANVAGVTTALAGFQADTTAKNGLDTVNGAPTVGFMSANASHGHTDSGHIHSLTNGNNQWRLGGTGTGLNAPGLNNTATFLVSVDTGSANIVAANTDHTHTVATNVTLNTGNPETRPDAVGVKYIIKAFDESFNLAGFANATSTTNGMVTPRKGQTALTANNISGITAGFSQGRCIGIYYQDQDGNHRLKFNIGVSFSTQAFTFASVSITGITSKNIAQFYQPLAGFTLGTTPGSIQQCYIAPNSNVLQMQTEAGSGISAVAWHGDIELDSKPSWA